MRSTPVPRGRRLATMPSCGEGRRSEQPHAADSSPAFASAPNDGGATEVGADPGWPHRAPRLAETGSPASVAVTAAHPADRSSASAPASCESWLHLRSKTGTATPVANAQTNASARSLPYPLERSRLAVEVHDRTAQLRPGEAIVVRPVHRCLCPQKQFAGCSDDSHNL